MQRVIELTPYEGIADALYQAEGQLLAACGKAA